MKSARYIRCPACGLPRNPAVFDRAGEHIIGFSARSTNPATGANEPINIPLDLGTARALRAALLRAVQQIDASFIDLGDDDPA